MTKNDRDAYEEERRPVRKSSGTRPPEGRPSGGRSSGSRSPEGRSSGGRSSRPPERENSGRGNSSGKKMSRREKEKKKRKRIILFIAEIFVLLIMVMVLYLTLSGEKTERVEIDYEDIIINETVKQAEETTMKGYRNSALFGVDSTTGALSKNTR